MTPRLENLKNALDQLEESILYYKKEKDQAGQRFLALCKAFEVAVEYSWKDLKQKLEAEAIEAYSPKQIIRQAARANLIPEAEPWLNYIQARNSSVHDYFGIPEANYVKLAEEFLENCHKNLLKP